MLDSQLLERFVVRRDSSAFRDLLNRHGPAVLRVCRRHLDDPHEAEDALQATFLILLRRAPSIRDPELLQGWLVGVARRVALRARRQGVLRSRREQRWAEMRQDSREEDAPLNEIRRVVREEMGQLPEVHRQALALCYLEGLTHEQAAGRLGWPVGTLKVRLVRGRQQLRERLDRRGVALSVALLFLLMRRNASASLTTELVDATVESMTMASTGEVAALQAKYPHALRLARKVHRLGGGTRWGLTILILAFTLVASSGVALAYRVKSSHDQSIQASARLLKVLVVDCR